MWEIFIFDFEQISHIVLLFPLLEMPARKDINKFFHIS